MTDPYVWIDPFARIEEAERIADWARDRAEGAEQYAHRKIRAVEDSYRYEVAHLRAVNDHLLKLHPNNFALKPVAYMPIDGADPNLRPADIKPMTATEALESGRGWYSEYGRNLIMTAATEMIAVAPTKP